MEVLGPESWLKTAVLALGPARCAVQAAARARLGRGAGGCHVCLCAQSLLTSDFGWWFSCLLSVGGVGVRGWVIMVSSDRIL